MTKINVIYHHFPHYRAPVLRELVSNGEYEYSFHASLKDLDGIKVFKGDDVVDIHPLDFKFQGPIWVLKGYWSALLDTQAKAIVLHAPPNMPAAWLIMIFGRLLGKKMFFWVHGWLKPEPILKRFIRNIFFGLSDKVMVYGERARKLASESGFSSKKVWPIYNSLDYDKAKKVLSKIGSDNASENPLPQSFFKEGANPIIICTARLTEQCQFDLLLTAAEILKKQGAPINILLVGDGPERKNLENTAIELDLDVHFYGACYDEDILGNLLYYSDLTVSPGKIGLTAMHSLTYGTPAITHGKLDAQMPEFEAIEAGKSGLFFQHDDANDLADKILLWLNMDQSREVIRKNCQSVISKKWNPARQRERIEACLDTCLKKSKPS